MRLLLLFSLGFAACGGGGGGGVSNDPGRSVTGCSDCSSSEYCLILSGSSDRTYCATSGCGVECACILADGKSRLDACQQSSCQQGSGIVYCFEH
jgi:hypothetical protein